MKELRARLVRLRWPSCREPTVETVVHAASRVIPAAAALCFTVPRQIAAEGTVSCKRKKELDISAEERTKAA